MSIRQPRSGKIEVGFVAPYFTLPSQSGEMVDSEDFLEQKLVVLCFYSKDDTPSCTREVCAFRDDYEEFRKLDAEVIGIGSASPPRRPRAIRLPSRA